MEKRLVNCQIDQYGTIYTILMCFCHGDICMYCQLHTEGISLLTLWVAFKRPWVQVGLTCCNLE